MIATLDDAVRFVDDADGESVAALVVDWRRIATLFDAEGLWDADRFATWVASLPDPAASLAELLEMRHATAAAFRLLGGSDLAGVAAAYRRAIGILGARALPFVDAFRSGRRMPAVPPTDLDGDYLIPLWLHQPTRRAPFAVTMLIPAAELQSTQRDLRRSEARYRAIVEDQTDFIVRYRSDGVRTFVNEAYAEFFGGRAEDLVGTSFFAAVAPEHRSGVEKKVRLLASGEAAVLAEEHLSIRHDGVKRWTHWVDRGIFDERGALIELQAVGRDITARREAERERLAFEQRLAQAQKMEALGTLAGGLAHDFNNTLTGILGYSDLIRRSAAEDAPAAHYAESIREAAERASELTRNLLQLSRREPRRRGRCDVREVVESASRLLRAAFPPRIALWVEIAGVPAAVADGAQLSQALINLGLNARDAIPERGNVTVSVSLVRGDSGDEIALRVSDDGVGIPEEIRSRLFEPFFTTKPEGRGTGLGLPMVYACAAAHGGRVDVQSELGVGTTFELRLPFVAALPETAPAGSAAAAPASGETILLVDDDPLVLLHSRMVLERSGYRVVTAAGGREAVERFVDRLDDVDAVVTDLVMPGGSGRELEHAFHARRPDLPILLVTGGIADHGPGDFAAVLEKPFSPEELVRDLRAVLDRGADDVGRAAVPAAL